MSAENTATYARIALDETRRASERGFLGRRIYTGRWLVEEGRKFEIPTTHVDSKKREVKKVFRAFGPELTHFGLIAFAVLTPLYRMEHEAANLFYRRLSQKQARSIQLRETYKLNRDSLIGRREVVHFGDAHLPEGKFVPAETARVKLSKALR